MKKSIFRSSPFIDEHLTDAQIDDLMAFSHKFKQMKEEMDKRWNH